MSDGKKLKPQHAPKAPHEDPVFLESTPARPLRILAEYINPLAQLKRVQRNAARRKGVTYVFHIA